MKKLKKLFISSFIIVGVLVSSINTYALGKVNEIDTITIPNKDIDRAHKDVVYLEDGSYVIVGSVKVTGFNYQAEITKYSANGTLDWQSTYGGTGGESFDAVTVDNDGNLIAVGHTSSASLSPYMAADYDKSASIIVKYDGATGAELAAKCLGSTKADTFSDVIVKDNTVIAVGQAGENSGDFAGLTNNRITAVIVLFDNDSSLTLDQIIELEAADIGYFKGITMVDDNYVLIGEVATTDKDFTISTGDNGGNGDTNVFAIKYNSTFTSTLWSTIIGGTRNDAVSGLTQVDGGYLITGTTVSKDNDFAALAGNYSIGNGFIAKIKDSDGALEWATAIVAAPDVYSYLSSVAIIGDTFMAVGTLDGPVSSGTLTADCLGGYGDILVVTGSVSDGTISTLDSFGGTGYDYASNVKALTDHFVIIGDTESTDETFKDLSISEYTGFIITFKEFGPDPELPNTGETTLSTYTLYTSVVLLGVVYFGVKRKEQQ